jgi:hypothetical protein
VWQGNLAGLETGVVADVALRGERQPDRRLGLWLIGIGQEILLLAIVLRGSLLDVGEKRFGCLENLIVPLELERSGRLY